MTDQDTKQAGGGLREPPMIVAIIAVVLFVAVFLTVEAATAAGHGNHAQADEYFIFAAVLVILDFLLFLGASLRWDNDG